MTRILRTGWVALAATAMVVMGGREAKAQFGENALVVGQSYQKFKIKLNAGLDYRSLGQYNDAVKSFPSALIDPNTTGLANDGASSHYGFDAGADFLLRVNRKHAIYAGLATQFLFSRFEDHLLGNLPSGQNVPNSAPLTTEQVADQAQVLAFGVGIPVQYYGNVYAKSTGFLGVVPMLYPFVQYKTLNNEYPQPAQRGFGYGGEVRGGLEYQFQPGLSVGFMAKGRLFYHGALTGADKRRLTTMTGTFTNPNGTTQPVTFYGNYEEQLINSRDNFTLTSFDDAKLNLSGIGLQFYITYGVQEIFGIDTDDRR